MKSEVERVASENKELLSENKQLSVNLASVTADRDRLSTELNVSIKVIESLQGKHDGLVSEKSDLEGALSKLESEHQSLQSKHDGLVSDKSVLLSEKSDLEGTLSKLESEHQSLQSKHDFRGSTLRELIAGKTVLGDELSRIQQEHEILKRKHGELQAIYLPYKEEIEKKIADTANKFTELTLSAEQLLSNLKEFLGQNTTLSELPSLMLLSRKIKTAIKDKKFKPLSSDYEKLVSALDGIPAYSTFLDAKEKARQEELARLEAEKKEEARRKKEEEERRQQAEAERKRKAEEATIEKGKELALEMRRYVVENMDAEDIEDRLADLAQLEAAIEKKDYAVIRSFVGTDEAEKRRLAEEQEKKEAEDKGVANEPKNNLEPKNQDDKVQDNLSALPGCIEQQPVWNNCVGARAFCTRKDEYVGEFKDNKKHGHGIYTWANGDKYVGQFMNGRQHGQGTLTYSVGSNFVGEWKDDKRHGHGTYTYSSGGKYGGEWKDGKQVSRGPFINADGTVAKDNSDNTVAKEPKNNLEPKNQDDKVQDNLSALPGCIEQQPVWNNCVGARAFCTRKDEYVGEFKDNKKHGHGIYTWANGDKYVGQFMNGRQHGQGTLTYSVGSNFVGEWKDDKRHGHGTYTYSSGGKYGGEWKDGKEVNRGPYINADGTVAKDGVAKEPVTKSGGREYCLENVRKNLGVLRIAFDDPICKVYQQQNMAAEYKRCVANRITQMGWISFPTTGGRFGPGVYIANLQSWQNAYANFAVCPE